MSSLLSFAETTLQEVALIFMAVVYIFKVRWMLKFKAGQERQAKTGSMDMTKQKGILLSMLNVAMPWVMESSRHKWFFYLTFVVFHIGVTFAILLSFIIPYGPGLLTAAPFLVKIIQLFCFLAFLIGIYRIIRRLGSVYMRAISTPDDYFSIFLLTIWLYSAYLAAPNSMANGEAHLLTYFFLTAFFLIYVPFSKISHYIYYPFTRYYLGKTLGHRGVFPGNQQAN